VPQQIQDISHVLQFLQFAKCEIHREFTLDVPDKIDMRQGIPSVDGT
jgi:hypothetical protein